MRDNVQSHVTMRDLARKHCADGLYGAADAEFPPPPPASAATERVVFRMQARQQGKTLARDIEAMVSKSSSPFVRRASEAMRESNARMSAALKDAAIFGTGFSEFGITGNRPMGEKSAQAVRSEIFKAAPFVVRQDWPEEGPGPSVSDQVNKLMHERAVAATAEAERTMRQAVFHAFHMALVEYHPVEDGKVDKLDNKTAVILAERCVERLETLIRARQAAGMSMWL